MQGWPELPTNVAVAAGENLGDLWERFEQFEALHHRMRIANPMSSADLDRVVELLRPDDGDAVLDLACGYGELLRRLRSSARISGTGVDLSPWMLATAAAESDPSLHWVVDNARDHGIGESWQIVVCLGASWVWHGLHGTIRAVAERAEPGARIAIGDMHVRPGLDPDSVTSTHGRVDSLSEITQWFDDHDIDIIERVATSDDSWDAYQDRIDASVTEWAAMYPGERSQRWLDEARSWRDDHDRDRSVLTWSVWVGRKRNTRPS